MSQNCLFAAVQVEMELKVVTVLCAWMLTEILTYVKVAGAARII